MPASTSLKQLLERQTQALEHDPDNPKLRVEVAEILESMHLGQEALAQYETAARLFVNLGLYREAAATCTRVLNILPDHKEARRILQGIHRRGLAGEMTGAGDEGSAQAEPNDQQAVADLQPPGGDAVSTSTLEGDDAAVEPAPAPDDDVDERVDVDEAAQFASAAATPEQAGAVSPVVTRELVSRPVGVQSAETDLGALSATGLLALLPPEVVACGIQQPFPPGEIIVREDERTEQLFVLIEGRAKASCGEGDGQTHLGYLEEGAFFGELALLGDGRCHMTVVALDPCAVLMIPRSQLKRLMVGSSDANRLLRGAYRDRLKAMVLRTSPLFAPLHDRVARRFLRQFEPLKHETTTEIFVEGTTVANGLLLVLLGSLEVSVRGPDGEVRLAALGPGEYFGLLSLLRSRPCCATVRSTTFVQLLHLPAEDFHHFSERHPRFKAMLDKEARRRDKLAQDAAGGITEGA